MEKKMSAVEAWHRATAQSRKHRELASAVLRGSEAEFMEIYGIPPKKASLTKLEEFMRRKGNKSGKQSG